MTSLPPPSAPPEQVVLTIGDIGVSRSWVVTPQGAAPLRDSQWTIRNWNVTHDAIPTWAVVMAVIGTVFCLIGLLFLLVKEPRTTVRLEVAVRSGSLYHAVQFPSGSAQKVAATRGLVAQAQAMAAQAPPITQ